METIHLHYVAIKYEEPVIRLTFKAGAELGFPEMEEMVFYCEKLSNKKNYVVLSDSRCGVTVTPEGRKYSAQAKNSPLQKGTAVLVKNEAYRIALNLFLGFQEPEFEYKVFTDEEKAIEWLRGIDLQEKMDDLKQA
jgi:hypothetical protein